MFHHFKRSAALVSIVAAVSLLILASDSRTFAAGQASSITSSPVSVDLAGKPGASVSTTMQIQNNGQQPLQLEVQLKTFSAGGTSGQAAITDPSPNDDSVKWVHFSQTTFTAMPGVWTPIVMTINLPKNAAFGYYYAVLFKSAAPAAQKNVNVVKSSNVVLVLLDAQAPGEKRQLQVVDFTTGKHIYEYLPTAFHITARNTGNVYFPPHGDVYISKDSDFRSIIDAIPVNSGGGNILPNSNRVFKAIWNDGFPVFQNKTLHGQPLTDKSGHPVRQLRWYFSNASKFRFGKYYARLTLVYNDGQRDIPVYATTSFWVIPWKLLVISLLLFLLLLGGLFGFGRFAYRRVHHVARRR